LVVVAAVVLVVSEETPLLLVAVALAAVVLEFLPTSLGLLLHAAVVARGHAMNLLARTTGLAVQAAGGTQMQTVTRTLVAVLAPHAEAMLCLQRLGSRAVKEWLLSVI
jgi:hypothetical protein